MPPAKSPGAKKNPDFWTYWHTPWGFDIPIGINAGASGAAKDVQNFNPISAAGGAIAAGISAGFTGIISTIWKSMGSHAWEWVIGLAMLLVFIGSAKRVAAGGGS